MNHERAGLLRVALAKIPVLRAAKQKALALVDELERSLLSEWAKMSGADTIQFDERKLHRLKVAYKRAMQSGKTEFTFEGHELLVSYAKYMIEYLEGKFK